MENNFRHLSQFVILEVANDAYRIHILEMSENIQKLIDAARSREMSGAEKEAQRRSFAYGNAHIENDRVTREMVAKAADKIGRSQD